MPTSIRIPALLCGCLFLVVVSGCQMVPQNQYRMSQLRNRQLHQQNQMSNGSLQSILAQKQQLEQQNAALNARVSNLEGERSQLNEKYVSMLNRNQKSPLSPEATSRFQDLARRYPEFEFDPATGVSKFRDDILFDLGSDQIKSSAENLLREFAQIMNQGEAQQLNILVVGHTDNTPISKASTKAKHPTNWHLSTDRADEVVLKLAQVGISEKRMGAAGYSMFQPVAPNSDGKSKAQNRRVEIFVLAPDAVVAGWDPAHRH
ncbi:MAG: OmpA family protein [Planctomycetota bacterium]|nr:OmpA family protein [Planctomycetota bacterium]MDA1212999.1 OmpA family protein [Planctomycetota bacterium]